MRTGYTRVGDSRVGYSVHGDGPPLVVLPAGSSHLDLMPQHEPMGRFLDALAEFSQVILFDHRGCGVSEPFTGTDDEWPAASVEDALAVLDALELERADLLLWDVGSVGLRLAATHPERVRRLVLLNTCARFLSAPDYPFGPDASWLDGALEGTDALWGTGEIFTIVDTWVAAHPEIQAWWGLYERSAGSPARQRAMNARHLCLDARDVVARVQQPALILHASRNKWIDVGHARWLDQRLPDSRLVEYDDDGHFWFYQHRDLVVRHVEEFLTGTPRARGERLLATVLFTDIVASTDRVVAGGDSAWTAMLDDHDSVAAATVRQHDGRLVKSTGDGVLALFTSPADAARCAAELRRVAIEIGLAIRAGLHVGEVELRGDDVAGVTVHVAARVQALAEGNEILVTRTLVDVVAGSAMRFADRGTHELKGVPRTWELFALDS